jgi:hypothetical protein
MLTKTRSEVRGGGRNPGVKKAPAAEQSLIRSRAGRRRRVIFGIFGVRGGFDLRQSFGVFGGLSSFRHHASSIFGVRLLRHFGAQLLGRPKRETLKSKMTKRTAPSRLADSNFFKVAAAPACIASQAHSTAPEDKIVVEEFAESNFSRRPRQITQKDMMSAKEEKPKKNVNRSLWG